MTRKQMMNSGLALLAMGGMLALAACEAQRQPGGSPVSRAEAPATNGLGSHLSMTLRGAPSAPSQKALQLPPESRETYAPIEESEIKRVAEAPVSTFSIDVDTGAYSNIRRFLNQGQLPPRDAVRVEELVNYFDYDYPTPVSRDMPFNVTTEVAPSPWNPKTHLLHIGIKAYDVARTERPPANLVFLVDVSGSMQSPDKLELVKRALSLLTGQMTKADRISLVTYANGSGVALPSTSGDDKAVIRGAIEDLRAGGGTNGGAGIEMAYREARKGFIDGGINRIVLATDGDVNLGLRQKALMELVETSRDSGITLTTLGFGTGNYNDYLLESLADLGNGNHAYIDSMSEARKVLVEEMNSTFLTVAKDVKLQVEFNPAVVAEYRLIGYENRVLNRADFSNDKVDAGDIGAGHTVTALYEIALVGSGGEQMSDLRYGRPVVAGGSADELAFIRIRHKSPESVTSREQNFPIYRHALHQDLDETGDNYRFAAAVAAFGQMLRGGRHTGQMRLGDVEILARSALGPDPQGYRREFIRLVGLANAMKLAQN